MPSNAKQPDPDPVDFGWNCGSTTCQRSRLRARQWRHWRHLSYLVVPRLKTRKVLMEWYIWRTSCRASIRSQACTIPFSMVCTPVLCSTFERCCAHRYNMLQPLKSLNAQVKFNIFAFFFTLQQRQHGDVAGDRGARKLKLTFCREELYADCSGLLLKKHLLCSGFDSEALRQARFKFNFKQRECVWKPKDAFMLKITWLSVKNDNVPDCMATYGCTLLLGVRTGQLCTLQQPTSRAQSCLRWLYLLLLETGTQVLQNVSWESHEFSAYLDRHNMAKQHPTPIFLTLY